MAKKQFNLETELTAKIDDLTAKLNRASGQINNFKKKNESTGVSIKAVFDGAAKAVGVIAGAFIAAKGILASFDKVIDSTQATGDSFRLTMEELKNSVTFFSSSLAQMDFTDFWKNLKLSNDAAKTLLATLDLLGDVNRADSITTAKEEINLSRLENIYIDKRIDKQTRLNALAEATKIKQQAVNRELGKQNVELDATLNSFTKLPSYIKKFGDDTKPATRLITEYGDKWRSGVNDLSNQYNKLKKEADTKHSVTSIVNTSAGAMTTAIPDIKADEAAKKKFNDFVASLSDKATVIDWAGLLESVQQNDQQLDKVTALLVKGEKLAGELEKINVEDTRNKNKILGKEGVDAELKVSPKLVINPDEFTKEIELLNKEAQDIIDEVLANDTLELNYQGLPKLNADLAELQRLQSLSSSSNVFESYQVQIDETIKKIQQFKGEAEDTTISLSEFYQGIGGAFSSLADSAESLGNKGAAAFLNIVSATAQSIDSITQFIEVIKTMSAVKQAADAAELATAPAKIAANSGVAVSEGVKAGAGVPFPGNIVAIAASVAAVLAAISSIGAFANGGIVGGNSFWGDNVTARVNSGEMILNSGQQANLFKMLNTGGSASGGGSVVFEIQGNALVGVLNNHNKRNKNMR